GDTRAQDRGVGPCFHAANGADPGGPKETTSVTTCPRCGRPTPAGVAVCNACGARLAPSTSPMPMPPEDAMPEWMRQFQASPAQGYMGQGYLAAAPQAPDGGMSPSQGFSAGSLMSEDALPDWLRNNP